jgi:hypothetical protein
MSPAWPKRIDCGQAEQTSPNADETASRKAKLDHVFGQRRKSAKMFRAGLYAHVSTSDQQTLAMQNRAMREYAGRRGWIIALQVREANSGAVQREAREKLLEAARRRQIDVVLVWRLDRWGRLVTDLLATLQELSHLGVGFVSLTEALDLTTRPVARWQVCWRFSLSSKGRSCENELGPVWRRPGRTGNVWVGRPAWPYTLRKSGNCIALASANPKSLAAYRSGARQSAESWE